MSDDSYRCRLAIDADHPSLAGHFPGEPVVPGVLLLDRVLDAAEHWLGRAAGPLALPQVKFVQPLLPAQSAEISLTRSATRLRFRVERDGELLASGEFEWMT